MTWNYRIVKYKNPDKVGLAYGLHEIYYDKFKRPRAMTAKPMKLKWDLSGDSPEEILDILSMMTKDALAPILNEEDITHTEEFWEEDEI